LAFPLSRGKASFVLDDRSLRVEKAELYLGSLPLRLQAELPGPLSWLPVEEKSELGYSCRLEVDDLGPQDLEPFLGPRLAWRGRSHAPSPLRLELAGNLRDLKNSRISGQLDFDWSAVSFFSGSRPLDRLRGALDFDRQKIILRSCAATWADSDLLFNGSLTLAPEAEAPLLQGRIESSRLRVDDLLALWSAATDLDLRPPAPPDAARVAVPVSQAASQIGTLALPVSSAAEKKPLSFLSSKLFRVELEGLCKQLVLPAQKGLDALAAASQTPPEHESELEKSWRHLTDFSFALAAGPDFLRIDACDWRWGGQGSLLSLGGELFCRDGLSGELDIVVKNLDLDVLFGENTGAAGLEPEESAAPPTDSDRFRVALLGEIIEAVKDDWVKKLVSWKDKLVAERLRLAFSAQQLCWRRMVLDELVGSCRIDDSGLHLERLAGRSFDGSLRASADWFYEGDSFNLEAEFSGINFESFNDYLKNPDRGLPMQGGRGGLSLDLEWRGASLREWKAGLDGLVDFSFHDGRLKKFTFIANLCSLLNVSQFAALRLPRVSIDQGVPYQVFSGRGVIGDGVMEVDEMIMRGPAFNLMSSGTISFLDETLELDLGVQPLQTVDKLLATIPVVGYIITGKEETFVVLPLKAHGGFSDIRITAQPIAGFGKQLGGIAQRFFSTPGRIIEMPGRLYDKISQ